MKRHLLPNQRPDFTSWSFGQRFFCFVRFKKGNESTSSETSDRPASPIKTLKARPSVKLVTLWISRDRVEKMSTLLPASFRFPSPRRVDSPIPRNRKPSKQLREKRSQVMESKTSWLFILPPCRICPLRNERLGRPSANGLLSGFRKRSRRVYKIQTVLLRRCYSRYVHVRLSFA